MRLDTPYLLRCGVLCRLFPIGSYHNLQEDKRKSAPHFLCIYLIKIPRSRRIRIICMSNQNLKFTALPDYIIPIINKLTPIILSNQKNKFGLKFYNCSNYDCLDETTRKLLVSFMNGSECLIIKDGYYLKADNWSDGLLDYINSYFETGHITYNL